MEIDVRTVGKTLVASVRGKVDTVSAQDFEKGLNEALKGEEILWVIDFSGVEYISSAGLRVVIGAGKALKAKGGGLRLSGASGSVKKVFEISGFFSLFPHFDTQDKALEDF